MTAVVVVAVVGSVAAVLTAYIAVWHSNARTAGQHRKVKRNPAARR